MQVALAWLLAQKPWIVPIPGTTQMAHMLEHTGVAQVLFCSSEIQELNASVAAIQVQGARLHEGVLRFSNVEVSPKKLNRRMTMTTDLSRRMLLAAPALLSACSDTRVNAAPVEPAAKSKLLVAYFSRSGNTKVIAGTVQRALGAELFEIQPANAYPEDYLETVEQARQERDRGSEPALAATVPGLASYDTVFLAFPIWGETAPPVIRSFLKTHDLSGKVLRPLITHGGYGLGSSMAVLQSHVPGAQIEPPFVMEADQERRTLTTITVWLDRTGLKK